MIQKHTVVVLAALAATGGPALAHHRFYAAELRTASTELHSAGFGMVHVTVDLDLIDLHIDASFDELSGTALTAHINGLTEVPLGGTAGVALGEPSLPGFPAGETSGDYEATITLGLASSYSPAFIAANGGSVDAAFTALLVGLEEGRVYFEIRSTEFPDGELRGFLRKVLGDMNCDGVVNFDDIDPFVAALLGEEAYEALYPECEWHLADANEDEHVDFDDIDAFILLLIG